MFTKSYIYAALCFSIRSSIAATSRRFTDYLLIKTTTKYTNFWTVSKMIQSKIDKVSKSIYVIIKGDKPIFSPDLTFKWLFFFIDSQPIKATTNYRSFYTVSKVIPRKIDKVSNSIFVIKWDKPISSSDLTCKRDSILE